MRNFWSKKNYEVLSDIKETSSFSSLGEKSSAWKYWALYIRISDFAIAYKRHDAGKLSLQQVITYNLICAGTVVG